MSSFSLSSFIAGGILIPLARWLTLTLVRLINSYPRKDKVLTLIPSRVALFRGGSNLFGFRTKGRFLSPLWVSRNESQTSVRVGTTRTGVIFTNADASESKPPINPANPPFTEPV